MAKTRERPQQGLTSALEDYLETIHVLLQDQPVARVRDIARARDVKAGSVSPALRRLADLGLVDYAQREYVTLTPRGEQEARKVYARHRLLMRFFVEVLRIPREVAERDACAMEHSLSDSTVDRLARLFEFLAACPNTVPEFLDRFHACALVHSSAASCPPRCRAKGGRTATVTLRDLRAGQQGEVVQVNVSGAVRQRMLDMGILPGALVEVERVAPGGQPVWIKLQGTQLSLRRAEAEAVVVRSP